MTKNIKVSGLLLGFLGFVAGCASPQLAPAPAVQINETTQIPFEAEGSGSRELVLLGVKLENTTFDIPIRINSSVERWAEYFTGKKGRKHFETYLERAEVFIPYILPILRENGLPEDLVYLAMIESGFNNHARSRAKAVGAWQFIAGTGRRYGLDVSWWLDERRDVRKSTRAAVEYLRDLYSVFRSWELAAAAYNAGEAKIARAIQRYGVMDFWTVTRHRFLRPETRNYVPKMIAAALLAKNRTLFGFPAQGHKPTPDEVVAPDGSVVKLETPPVPTPAMSTKGVLAKEHVVEFMIQSPADLSKIADAAGLTYAFVKSLNPELLRWCTPPHHKMYRLKLPQSVTERFLSTYNHPEFPREVKFRKHKVRPQETLQSIARNFGIKVDPLLDLNNLSKNTTHVAVGRELLLPIPADRTRSFAQLDLLDPPEFRKRKKGRRVMSVNFQSREQARRASSKPKAVF